MNDTEEPERYVRLGENDVYGYTPLLASRRDATVIDGYTAAQLLRQQGIENELTARYPDAVRLDPRPSPQESPGEREAADRAAYRAAFDAKKNDRIRHKQRLDDYLEQQKPGIPETSAEIEEPGAVIDPPAENPINNDVIRDLLGDVTNRT